MKQIGRMRLALIFVLIAAFCAATLYASTRYFLTSRRASRQIADRLEDILGVPVSIGEANVGVSDSSSLAGLQVYEAEQQRPETPWMNAKAVQADLSALDLAGGNSAPRRIVLSGAAITLRFDEDGHLLTKLPRVKPPTGQPFPQLVLENARLTLDQQGHPPLVIDGINAETSDKKGVLEISGTVVDVLWGQWTVTGTFRAADSDVSLRLKTPRAQVTQRKLEDLPFVSPNVWRQVKLDGVTPATLDLQFALGQTGVHYRLELDPEETTVDVTSIDLHADKASGKVIIEDRLVQLRNVRGRTADGDILLPTADLNFRQNPYDMTFDVGVSMVDLRKLPASWNIPTPPLLPRVFRSRMTLTGQAKLRVMVQDGKTRTVGDGDGNVEVSLVPVSATMPVRLNVDGEGFHFMLLPLGAQKMRPLPRAAAQ